MKFIFTYLLLFTSFILSAADISQQQAELVAKTQFKLMNNLSDRNTVQTKLIYSLDYDKTNGSKGTAFYVFTTSGSKGFVIVAGDDKVKPILGYSKDNTFEVNNMHQEYFKFMLIYRNGIAQIANDPAIQATPYIAAKWNTLLNDQVIPTGTRSGVGPLTTTTWSQRPYYNELCPGNNAPTGCVQTAICQIMNFWQHPYRGTGSYSFNHNTYGTLSANFSATTYDWANMPSSLSGSSDSTEVNAIATLMYHVGVAMEANYSEDGTGAFTHRSRTVLPAYFGYKDQIQQYSRSFLPGQSWANKLKDELDAGRVVLHSGFCPDPNAGHAFVVDGYDTTGKYSYNWGWGGSYNGFYETDNLNPGSTYTWNSGQKIFTNIEPDLPDFDLEMDGIISVTPSPIEFEQPFSVTTAVRNNGTNNYTGSFKMVFFDDNDNAVGEIDTIIDTVVNSNGTVSLTFASSGLAITPDVYYLGVYFQEANGQWSLVPENVTANNPIIAEITSTNSLGLIANSVITVNPNPIQEKDSLTVTFEVLNTDPSAFNGVISIDLHDLNGDWITEVGSINAIIGAGGTESVTINSDSLGQLPGSYKLVIWHKQTGSNWEIIQEGTFPNSLDVDIVGLAFAGALTDSYEYNDTSTSAYELPLTFNNNLAVTNTSGANIHVGSDIDYYKVHLDPFYTYLVYARVYDSYNDGGRGPFTNDMMFNYYFRNDEGDYYDDEEMPSIIASNISLNGEDFFFEVLPFYPDDINNNVGSYQIEIEVIRQGVTTGLDENAASQVLVYPNPANNAINIVHDGYDQISLVNINGQVIQSSSTTQNITNMDLSAVSAGVYFIQLRNNNNVVNKRIEVIK